MSTPQLPTSEVLNKAADLIEERGWTKGWNRHDGLCLVDAVAEASRGGGFFAALSALDRYFDRRPIDPPIYHWNDAPERTASEVIEVLRAAALVEAAREQSPDLTPLHDAALPKDAPGAWIREAIEAMSEVGA